MIKVLSAIVVPPHLSVSGGARAGEQLSASLTPYCDVTVATMMAGVPADSAQPGAVKVKRAPVECALPPLVPWQHIPSKFSTLFYASNIPALIARGNFDLVHIHNPMPALEMQRVAAQCLASAIPYVVHTHGFNEIANGRRVYKFGAGKQAVWRLFAENPVAYAVRNAAGVFALSEADIAIVRGMGFSGAELSIVSNGVVIPPLQPAPDDAATLAKLGIPTEDSVEGLNYFFLANHTPNKGLPVLLEAFASMAMPFTLVVGGERRSDIDYGAFVRRCRPGQKIIITGRLSDAEVAAIYRSTDLFVFPTLADTFPLVVLEAMSYGVPVVASRVGGIPHQLEEGCGALVAAGDVAALRAAVEALSANKEALAAMGGRARARAAAVYSWDGAARAAVAGYERILKREVRSQSPSPMPQWA